MKNSLLLSALAILFLLSSCSKEIFLFPANSGNYSTAEKSKKEVVTPTSERNLDESTDAVILTATSEENGLAIPPAATSLKQDPAGAGIKHAFIKEQITLQPDTEEPDYQNASAVYHPQALVHKQHPATNNEVPANKFRDNLFSILSFSCAMLGILIILMGGGVGIFLGLPAIIFGIMGLSKKEEFKSLATVGLILGIIMVVLLIVLLATLRPGK